MSEPKLTEALAKALCKWWDDVEGGNDPGHCDASKAPCDHCRSEAAAMVPEVARMVAEAEQTARAEAWDEGYILGVADLAVYRRPGTANPYRSTP